MIAAELLYSNKYPAIKQFIIDNKICFKHVSRLSEAISESFDEMEIIEYFLQSSLHLINSNKLIDGLLKHGTEDIEVLKPEDWHSLISEFAAFYLLHKKCGLNVHEYEPSIPGQSKTPDFSVKKNDDWVYFEVRDRCGVVVQFVPKKLKKLLDEIEKHHAHCKITPDFIDQNFKSYNLAEDEILEQIKAGLENKLKVLNKAGSSISSSVVVNTKCGKIRFIITELKDKKEPRLSYFYPYPADSIDNVRKWLFEEDISTRDGKKKTPQVKIAEEKNADYLMCRIPFYRHGNETFVSYIKPLFSDIKLKNSNLAFSGDPKLGTKLSGLIFFTSLGPLSDTYIIINNTSVEPKIKEWNV